MNELEAIWRLSQIEHLHHGLRRPTRRQAKRQRKSWRLHNRELQSDSMLNMGAPVGHRVIAPRDKLTAKHFAAHERRKNAGWIRG